MLKQRFDPELGKSPGGHMATNFYYFFLRESIMEPEGFTSPWVQSQAYDPATGHRWHKKAMMWVKI